MSNRQLEDRYEQEQAKAVAAALGISADDLDQLEWRLEPHESSEGLLYGHNVYFDEGSDPEVLKRIRGASDQGWIRIGPLPDNEEYPEE